VKTAEVNTKIAVVKVEVCSRDGGSGRLVETP